MSHALQLSGQCCALRRLRSGLSFFSEISWIKKILLSGLAAGGLLLPLAARAEYAFDAQDLFNAGRRATGVEQFAAEFRQDFAVQLALSPRWSFKTRFLKKYYYGFPVVSDFGVMKSDLTITRMALLAGYRIERAVGGNDLVFSLGSYGMHYGLVTPVELSFPEFSSTVTVSDFIGGQLYDDLINFRMALGPLFTLRVGWLCSAVYMAGRDGQLDRSQDSLVSMKVKWVYELELFSFLQATVRLDENRKAEYWDLAWTGFMPLVSWILSGNKEPGYLEYLRRIGTDAQSYRTRTAASGRLQLDLKVYSENYYRYLALNQRGGDSSNLVYELYLRKRFNLLPNVMIALSGTAAVFSPNYSKWHEGRVLRELTAGFELEFGLSSRYGSEIPSSQLRDYFRCGMRFVAGTFTDVGLGLFDGSGDLRTTGCQGTLWLCWFNTLSVNLEVSRNHPGELKQFVEAKDRTVFKFELELKTSWKWWK